MVAYNIISDIYQSFLKQTFIDVLMFIIVYIGIKDSFSFEILKKLITFYFLGYDFLYGYVSSYCNDDKSFKRLVN